jgi:hypothetical protein
MLGTVKETTDICDHASNWRTFHSCSRHDTGFRLERQGTHACRSSPGISVQPGMIANESGKLRVLCPVEPVLRILLA